MSGGVQRRALLKNMRTTTTPATIPATSSVTRMVLTRRRWSHGCWVGKSFFPKKLSGIKKFLWLNLAIKPVNPAGVEQCFEFFLMVFAQGKKRPAGVLHCAWPEESKRCKIKLGLNFEIPPQFFLRGRIFFCFLFDPCEDLP